MNILLNGFCGKMGQAVYNLIKSSGGDKKVTCGVDNNTKILNYKTNNDVCLMSNIFLAKNCDVVLDFSNTSALGGVLNFCVSHKIPLVIATTGFSRTQEQDIILASKHIPIFKCANFSFGVAVFTQAVKYLTSKLTGYDIEVVETHHKKKLDAPSGTALNIVKAINQTKLDVGELSNKLTVHSLRGGGVVGEHCVEFLGMFDKIKIEHTAFSRDSFAYGAMLALDYIKDKPAGLYDNILDLK